MQFKISQTTILFLLIGLQLLVFQYHSTAQHFVEVSTQFGSTSGFEAPHLSTVYGDHLYIIGGTDNLNFPTTDNSTFTGNRGIFFSKHDKYTLNVVESRLMDDFHEEFMIIEDSVIYILGTSDNPGMPNTGMGHSGDDDLYLLKLDLDGNFIGSTYFGGVEKERLLDVKLTGDTAIILMNTKSSDVPITDNSAYNNEFDLVLTLFDLTTLNRTFATYIGGNGSDNYGKFVLEGSTVYMGYHTNSTDLPSSGNDTLVGPYDIGITKFDLSTGTIVSSKYLGGTGNDSFNELFVDNDQLYVFGSSNSIDFPSANSTNHLINYVFARLDTNLNQITGSYLAKSGLGFPTYVTDNGYIYAILFEEQHRPGIYKFDLNGNILWKQTLQINSSFYYQIDLQVVDDRLFVLNPGSNALVTENCSYNSETYLTILSLDGDIEYSNNYPAGTPSFLSQQSLLFADSIRIILMGGIYSCFPSSDSNQITKKMFLQLVNMHPSEFQGDSIPESLTQTVCKNGLIDQIKMEPYMISGLDLPILYVCGVPFYQCDIEADYKWQQAPTNSGPWIDIPGAHSSSFSPSPVITDTYFRRLASERKCCGNELLQTSTVHCVLVNQYQAPYVDVGGLYFTCPGKPVSMNTTVIGGTPPFQYEWYEGGTSLGTTASITVTPTVQGSTIYTMIVTDANGCRQLDQSIIHSVVADAGPDISYCHGQSGPVLGHADILTPNATYQWSPSTGLSCTNCLHPVATPTTTTQYTLTMTHPVTGGTDTCITTDQVVVTPQSAPKDDFAGVDTIICGGPSNYFGSPAESGFSYEWDQSFWVYNKYTTPARLTSKCINPNPLVFTLEASKPGCLWVDSMELTVICEPSNSVGCGPREIGKPDQMPDLNETYQWTQLSGDGMITGPTNTPVTTVSASVNAPSVYQLVISYGGTSCATTITVPPCTPATIPISGQGCPSLLLNENSCLTVDPTAGGFPSPYSITWTPQVGLTTYTGNTICLTDSVQRTYTVTVISDLDSTITATRTVEANNPLWSVPEMNVVDTVICLGDAVNIGSPQTTGYSYWWRPFSGLNNPHIANPLATVSETTWYTVEITNTVTGCIGRDTAWVRVVSIEANAGDDVVVCDNGSISIGSTALPNTMYSWQPSSANWQNGTDQFSAQPEVLVGINTTFYLTAVDTLVGCIDYDTVDVSVGNPIIPFQLQDITYCSSQNSVQLGVGVPSGLSYSWTPTLNLSDPNIAMPILFPPSTIPVEYTLIVTNQSGCTMEIKQSVTPNTPAPLVESPKDICAGESVPIGSSQNITGPGITFSWSPTTGLDDPTSPNPQVTGTIPGITVYTLTVNNNGCTNSASVAVTVNEFPVSLNSKTVCAGSCISIGTTAVAGATYLWMPAYGLDDPTISNPIACVNTDTIYTLFATASTGCQTVVDVPVFIHPEPAPQVMVPPLTVCLAGSDTIRPNVTPTGSYIYNWSPNNGTLDFPNVETPSITLYNPGTYTYDVTVTNAITGCTSEASVDVIADACSVPDCPDLTPVVKILPGNISGNSSVQVAVQISEVNNMDTDGSVISVRIPSDPRLVFVWDIGLTNAALTPVQNANWNYLGDDGLFHTWTYNGPNLIINRLSTSSFGFIGFYDPQSTDGQTNVTASVVPFSGGECNLVNNADAELLIYFQ